MVHFSDSQLDMVILPISIQIASNIHTMVLCHMLSIMYKYDLKFYKIFL